MTICTHFPPTVVFSSKLGFLPFQGIWCIPQLKIQAPRFISFGGIVSYELYLTVILYHNVSKLPSSWNAGKAVSIVEKV